MATPPNSTPSGEKDTAPLWRHLGAASKWRPEKMFYRINFANEKKIRDENLSTHCDLKTRLQSWDFLWGLLLSWFSHHLAVTSAECWFVRGSSVLRRSLLQPSRWAAMPSEQTLDRKYMYAFTAQPLWHFPRKSVWSWHTNRKLLSSEPGCLTVTSPVFNVTVAMFILCSLRSHDPKSSAGLARLHSPAFPIPSH